MSSLDLLFSQDVLLDQDHFQKASAELTALSGEMDTLRQDIDGLLKELEMGFATPAGRKFILSCKENLLQPMKDQADVIQHVADNLTQAQGKYEAVFEEFEALNRSIGGT